MPSKKRQSQVLEILRSVLGPTESQSGCLSCRIYEEDGPDQATVFCGHWKTEAALREHLRSELYRRVLAASELASGPPEFCFHDVRRTRGLELIYRLRGCEGEPAHGSSGA